MKLQYGLLSSQTSAVKAEALLDAHPEIFWSQHFQHGRDDLRAMHSKPDGPLSPSGDLQHAARAQLPSLLLHVDSKLVLKPCGCGEISTMLLSRSRFVLLVV